MTEQISRRDSTLDRHDLWLVLLVAAAALVEVGWCLSVLGDVLWHETSFDLWFQADTPRVIANLTDARSNHYRSSVHPMAPGLLTTPVLALSWVLGDAALAARVVLMIVGAASAVLTYLCLRWTALQHSAALAFTALLLSSAGFVFWCGVPELNMAAMLSMLASLALLAHRRVQDRWVWVAAASVTMGITLTNWNAGLLVLFARFRWQRASRLAVYSVVAVFVWTLPQSKLFHGAQRLGKEVVRESRFSQVGAEEDRVVGVLDPVAALRTLFASSMAAPLGEVELQRRSQVVTNQQSGLMDRSPAGLAGLALFAGLIVVGAFQARRGRRDMAAVAALMLVFNGALHAVYGDTTFLYAPHVLPAFVLLASFAALNQRRRGVVLAAAWLAAALLFCANAEQFQRDAAAAAAVIAQGGNPPSPLFKAGGAVLP